MARGPTRGPRRRAFEGPRPAPGSGNLCGTPLGGEDTLYPHAHPAKFHVRTTTFRHSQQISRSERAPAAHFLTKILEKILRSIPIVVSGKLLLRELVKKIVVETRESDLDAALVAHPVLVKFKYDLLLSSEFLVSASSLPAGANLSDVESAARAIGWSIRQLNSNEIALVSPAETARRHERESNRSRAMQRAANKPRLGRDPKPAQTSYAKKQLYSAALQAGHALFDSHLSGLIWSSESIKSARIVLTTVHEIARNLARDVGDDALEPWASIVGTFEFIFFPSRPGEGIDASDELDWAKDAPKMTDVDGNIYSCLNEFNTVIFVVKPSVTTREEFTNIVADELAKK